MTQAPAWARWLLTANAGLAFLGIYFGNTYPHIAFDILGVVGAINAGAAFQGWGGSDAPSI